MSSTIDEKTSFGATVQKTPNNEITSPAPIHLNTSTLSKTGSNEPITPTTKDSNVDLNNPFSAFYNHEAPTPAGSKTQLDVHTTDLEGQPISNATTTSQALTGYDCRTKECSMWPSMATLKHQEKARRQARRGCHPMKNMGKRQKLTFKIVIAAVLVAVAIAVGIGISKAVGGGVWAGNGKTGPIDPPHH